MNFTEQVAKALLQQAGIAIPRSALEESAEAARALAPEIGPLVVKAQVPTGKRGKAGGIKLADSPEEAAAAATAIGATTCHRSSSGKVGHPATTTKLATKPPLKPRLEPAPAFQLAAGC